MRTIEWDRGQAKLIDQRRLPQEYTVLAFDDYRDVARAIRGMTIRGAPAIGAAAAFGVALAARNSPATTPAELLADLKDAAQLLRATRPTAANLSWAVERMLRCAQAQITAGADVGSTADILLAEAQALADEDIAINYDEIDLDIDSGDTKTDRSGNFTAYVTVPKSTAGIHHVTVIQLENEVVTEFSVEPDVTINPTSGEADTRVTILGTGFGRRENVVIYFDASEVAKIPTDRVGDFAATFDVPKFTAGLYEIEIDDGENIQTAKFTIISPQKLPIPKPPIMPAVIEINSLAGNVGAEIVVSGTGFVKDGTVTVEYDNELVTSTTTNASGIFITSFHIPISAHGEHIMIISDGLNTKELTFTVES